MPVSVSLLAASSALRVASLNLCTDEYLLLLARPGEIASVSRLSHDAADSSLWRQARRYPANRGTLEGALATQPTLLLTMGGGGRSTGPIARRMGIRTLNLPFPRSVQEVEENMVRLAGALGDSTRASNWQRRLARIGRMPRRPRDAIFLGAGGVSVDAHSIGAEWMRFAGLRQRPLPGGRASLEELALHPPAVLLRSSYRRKEHSLGQAWLDHPLAHPARSRTLWTDGRPWTCSGPLMLAEIVRLRASN